MNTEEKLALFDRLTDLVSGYRMPSLPRTDFRGVLLSVLRLHRPMGREYDGQVCQGCQDGDKGSTAPEWPCDTIKLIADYYDQPQQPDILGNALREAFKPGGFIPFQQRTRPAND